VSRISLYKHELDAVVQLTIGIIRECDATQSPVEVGPIIFSALIDALYKRGSIESSGPSLSWQEFRDPSQFADLREQIRKEGT
jgi:hypothetical protein